jgi:hypothetical protein
MEVFRSRKNHYQPCTQGDSPLTAGISVVDVPFSHGTLSINHKQPNAFTAADIDLLERFATIVSEGFQRFLDISERNQARRRIHAVDRVRGQVLLMDNEEDLDKVLECVADSLRDAKVNFTNCCINLFDVEESPCGVPGSG